MIVRRDGDWLTAKVGEELVMMSAERGNYLGLSEVGTRVWELIEAPRDLDDICALLEAEFDVAPETCRREVEEFLDDLVKHGAAAFELASAS
jgi:hypothetical protein